MKKTEGKLDQFSISKGVLKFGMGQPDNRQILCLDFNSQDRVTLMNIQIEIFEILRRMEDREDLPAFHEVRDKIKSISEESKP